MTAIVLEVVLIVLLILANGVFASAEIAVVTSRKARLQSRSDGGDRRARAALRLAENQGDFLSTVQVGITLIGIVTGVFGGATLAEHLANHLDTVPLIAPHGESAAVVIVVVAITFLSVIAGELVPKRVALAHPERVAAILAPMMGRVARLSRPFVRLLTSTSNVLVRILRIPDARQSGVTDEELRALLRAGASSGEFDPAEEEMVRNVLNLGDRTAAMLMRHRRHVVWLDVHAPLAETKQRILETGHSRYPLGDGSLDRLIGVVETKDLLGPLFAGRPLELRNLARRARMVHETMPALEVLRLFQESKSEMVMVSDEFGSIEGVLTLSDIAASVLGDDGEAGITIREDGSMLVDGLAKFDEFWDAVRVPGVERRDFATVAGFVVARLGKIPSPADHFEAGQWRFEVLDLDGRRVDKVLVSRVAEAEEEA